MNRKNLALQFQQPQSTVDFELDNVKSSGIEGYDELTFSWALTNLCQYRCSYCYAWEFLEQQIHQSYKDVWKSVVKRLSIKTLPKFNVELLGGDPTLHPNILEILRALNSINNCLEVELVTNLAKPLTFFQQLDHKNYSKLQISASYHPEYDKNGSFGKKCIELNKCKNILLFVNVNFLKEREYWDRTATLLELLYKHNIIFDLNLLHTTEKYQAFPFGLKSQDQNKDHSNVMFELVNEFKQHVAATTDTGADIFNPIVTRKVRYITGTGEKILTEPQVRGSNLDKFYGFNCEPLMWDITYDGRIENTCTKEPLDLLGKNAIKCIKCPVANGCDCDLMFNYYKTR